MAADYPLDATTRQTDIEIADGATSVFGPYGFKIFSTADVTCLRKLPGETLFTPVTSGLTIAKTSDEAWATFTASFADDPAEDTEFYFVGSRTPSRASAITKAATTALSTLALDKELTQLAIVQQELKRDQARALTAERGVTALKQAEDVPEGALLVGLGGGAFGAGPTFADLQALKDDAETAADEAQSSAAAAAASANRAANKADAAENSAEEAADAADASAASAATAAAKANEASADAAIAASEAAAAAASQLAAAASEAVAQAAADEVADILDGYAETEDGVIISDELGWALIRISTKGGIKTRLLDLAYSDDEPDFTIDDELGFVTFRVAKDGSVRMGQMTVATGQEAPGEFSLADESGFIIFRVAKDGALSHSGLTFTGAGDALDKPGEFSLADESGFIIFKVTKDGALSHSEMTFARPDDPLNEPGEFSVADENGFTALRVAKDGKLVSAGMQFSSADADLVVEDENGFEAFRLSKSGLTINGKPSGADAVAIASEWPDAYYDARGIYLPPPPNLSQWRRGRAGVLLQQEDCVIAFIGDSNTAGTNSDGGSNPIRAHAAAAISAVMMDAQFGANATGFYGRAENLNASTYHTYNPDVTMGSGWGFSSGWWSLGGEPFENSTTSDPLTFQPAAPWDTAEVLVALSAASSLSLDTGSTATNYTPSTGSIQKITYTAAALSAQPLNIKRLSGTVRIIGGRVRNSQSPQIACLNMGRGGAQAAHWCGSISNSFESPLNALPLIGAKLHIIELGLNEAKNAISLSAYSASMQTLISACLAIGDVMLVSYVTPSAASPAYVWQHWLDAMLDLARNNEIPFINMSRRFGDATRVVADGFKNDDDHANKYGYADKAAAIVNFLSQQ